jgi:sucrose phosphorylase
MRNQVQLITYTDRLAGSLAGLCELLDGPLANLFGAVHLLPFFHPIDGADAGFDPIDHAQVDERLGSWADVAAVAARAEVMADLIVNHVSSRSPQFLDYAARGSVSEYDGMFLTFDGVYPEGATEQDLAAIYRPRPALPFTPMTMGDGSRRILWTTFTAGQIDIDVRHPRGIEYLDRILRIFADSGISIVRLDAVGYAIKAAGTSCFMMPETFAFIDELTHNARKLGLEVLVEIHSYYERQIEIASRVDWVYDFALPPLILHAIFTGTAEALRRWIEIRPHNAVTVLDTHDGIGVIDIGANSEDRDAHPGLITDAEMDALVDRIHRNSRGESRRATGEAAANLDLYQVNCTFYDALGRDDAAYLLARVIQFFLPGVPQVYYVGLLAGSNDLALLGRTNVGRDINRHYYTREEIDRALSRPVVVKLLALIRLRNAHPAFGGEFELAEAQGETLELRWRNGRELAAFRVDLATLEHRFEVSATGGIDRFSLDDVGQLAEAGRLPGCAATEAPR